jgi:hypothetical protein
MQLYGRTSERAGDSPVTVDEFISDSQTLYIFGRTKPVRGVHAQRTHGIESSVLVPLHRVCRTQVVSKITFTAFLN